MYYLILYWHVTWTHVCTLTWLIRSKAPLLGKMAEFLESTDTVCCRQTEQEQRTKCFLETVPEN